MKPSLPLLSLVALFTALAAFFLPAAPAAAQSSLADQQFVFAYRLLQRNETKPADEAFADFLERFPNDPRGADVRYFRGLLARRAGDRTAALRWLKPPLNPTLIPASTVTLLRAQIHVETAQFDNAIADLESIDPAQLTPRIRASVLSLRGLAYRGTGNLTAAAAAFAAAAQPDTPLRPRALFDLARTRIQLGDEQNITSALTILNQILADKASPLVPRAAALAGDVSLRRKQYAVAGGYFKTVILNHQTAPEFAPAVLGAMWAARGAQRPDALLSFYQQFKNKLPANRRAEAAYLAGLAHADRNNLKQAAKTLEPYAADASPIQDKLLYRLALIEQQLQHPDNMRRALERLVAERPDSSLRDDAEFLLATNAPPPDARKQSIARLARIIARSDPVHPYRDRARYERARRLESANNPIDAARDYVDLIRAHPKGDLNQPDKLPLALVQDARLRLIDLHLRLDDPDLAAAQARDALDESHTPDNEPLSKTFAAQALYRLALAQVKLKRNEAADASFKKLDKDFPNHPRKGESAYYRGLLAIKLGRPDQGATQLLKAGRDDSLPTATRSNALQVASIRFRESGNTPRAARAIDALIALNGIDSLSTDERLFLAARKLDKNEPAVALALATPLLDTATTSTSSSTSSTSTATTTATAATAATSSSHAQLSPAQKAHALYLVGTATADTNPKNPEPAIDRLRHAVALDQGYAILAQQRLAQLFRDHKREDAAFAEYASLAGSRDSTIAAKALFDAATLHKSRAQRFRKTAIVETVQRELDQARALFKRLLVVYPQTDHAQHGAFELIEIEDDADAERVLDEIAAQTDTPASDYAKALLAIRQKKINEARFLLERIRDNDAPATPAWLRKRALATLRHKRFGS